MHFKIIKAETALCKKPAYPEVHRAESGSPRPLVPALEFHSPERAAHSNLLYSLPCPFCTHKNNCFSS